MKPTYFSLTLALSSQILLANEFDPQIDASVTKQEAALVLKSLPSAIACIVNRNKSSCAIEQLHVDEFDVRTLKALFVDAKPELIHAMPAHDGSRSILVDFGWAKDREMRGAIVFELKDDVVSAHFVTVSMP